MHFIEFPNLGIHLNVDPVAFTLGPFTVRWYGIVISLAIFSALLLALRQSPRFGIHPDSLIDMFMFALPVSVIFARLFFVVVEWDTFRNDLLGIFRIWEGGIAIYGAVIGAVLTVAVFCRVRKFAFWDWMDFAGIYLPMAQAIGRWGNFFNQELYGGNTGDGFALGMTGDIIQAWPNPGVDPARTVHPTFLYESVWNLLVFAILYRFRGKSKKRGQVFSAYLFLYSIGRFGMEFVRTDVFSIGDTNVRANMVVAAVIAVIGLVFFLLRGRTPDEAWVPLELKVAAATDAAVDGGADAEEAPVVGQSAYGDVLRTLEEQTQAEAALRAELAAETGHVASASVPDAGDAAAVSDGDASRIAEPDAGAESPAGAGDAMSETEPDAGAESPAGANDGASAGTGGAS